MVRMIFRTIVSIPFPNSQTVKLQIINLDQSYRVLTPALIHPEANPFNEAMMDEGVSALKTVDHTLEAARQMLVTLDGHPPAYGADPLPSRVRSSSTISSSNFL